MSTPAPLTIVVAEGSWGTIECAVSESGDVPALDFLVSELAQLREGRKDQDEKSARARFMALFQQMANYGQISPKRFKREMAGLCAFSHEVKNLQIRVPCFQDGKRWVLTGGFIKPGAKKGLGDWPEAEVRRATNMRAEYWARKAKLGNSARREGLS